MAATQNLDTYFMVDVSNFLQDPLRVAPVKAVHRSLDPCPSIPNKGTPNKCSQGFFLTGGLDGVSPSPDTITVNQDADLFVVEHLRGVQFDITRQSLDHTYSFETECRVFASDHGGFLICIQPAERDSSAVTPLNAEIVQCPLGISAYSSCVTNTTWHTHIYTGNVVNRTNVYSTSFSVSESSRTVTFARDNSSIIAVDDSQEPELNPIPVSASALLDVFDLAFNYASGGDHGDIGTSDFINVFYNTMNIGSISQSGLDIIEDQFNNLLALPFWYLQANDPFHTGVFTSNKPRDDVPDLLHTKAVLAKTSSRIVVGRTTAIIYIFMGSFLIFACVAVLVVGSLSRFAGLCPETTQWSTYDIVANCEIQSTATDGEDDLKSCRGLEGQQLRAALAKKVVVISDAR